MGSVTMRPLLAATLALASLAALETAAQAGTVPVYRLYRPANGDHMSSRASNEAANLGYYSEGSSLYYDTQPAGGHPVYRCYIWGWDHMESTDPNCENAGVNEGAIGYLMDGPAAGHQAYYRCSQWGNWEHFNSTDPGCEGHRTEYVLGYGPSSTAGGNYILYFQGRGWGGWNSELVSSPGWQNKTFAYDGNKRLDSDATNVTVRNAIATYCGGSNNCIVVCYSAGCLRTLKAIDDLRAAGTALPGLLWVEAVASAGGGTKLANMATSGFTGFLAKLLGQQEKIDFDLTPGSARSSYGYIQDSVAPNMMYHLAGSKDICKKILFWKICGNKYVAAGAGDGVVGFDSATGASTQGSYWNGCTTTKYPGRDWDYILGCGGEYRDHFGMPGKGVAVTAGDTNGTHNDKILQWGDDPNTPDCIDVYGECDRPFESASQDFSRQPSLVQEAADVSATSSNTTGETGAGVCAGKCGGYANGCWCDTYCTSFGDCCGDFYAANCPAVNTL